MKKCLAILIFGFAVAFNSFSAPTSAEQLRSEFEAALKAGDTNAILSLYDWDGVSNRTNGMNANFNRIIHLWSEFRSKYSTKQIHIVVSLRPLPSGDETEVIINGIRYRPNVSVIGMMKCFFDVDDNGTNKSWDPEIPYGETNGGFYFAGTTAEKIYEPRVKEKPFLISVTSTNFSIPDAYVISYVYLQNNQEFTNTFTGTNIFYKVIFANELKSCVLQKLSDDNNSLKLKINELSTNSLTLLDSETSSTNTPIIYETKIKNL